MKRIAIIAGTAQTLLSLTPAAPCIKPLLLTAVLLQTLCGAAGLALQGACRLAEMGRADRLRGGPALLPALFGLPAALCRGSLPCAAGRKGPAAPEAAMTRSVSPM